MAETEKQVKSLRSQISKKKDAIKAVQMEISHCQKEHSRLVNEKNSLQNKLRHLLNKKEIIEISDHAVVRYLERIEGVDLSYIRDCILTDEFMRVFKQLSDSGEFPSGTGFVVVVRNNRVVTVKN